MKKDRRGKSSSKPRVGYVLRMYPRFTQTFVVNEILELERQGVDVRILSLRKPTDGRFHASISHVRARAEYLPEFWVEDRAKSRRTHWNQFKDRPADYLRALRRYRSEASIDRTDFMQAALVLRWVRKQKLKHIHVHFGTQEASVAYLAHQMAGLSYSLTLHAFDIFRDNVDRALLARKINASRFIVTVSEYNRRFMVDNLPGVDPEKIRVNYNGIDLHAFDYVDTDRRPLTLIGVGRLIEKKGFIHLVRAVARLKSAGLSVQCTIVGDGPERAALADGIKRHDAEDCVTLAGSLPQAEVRGLLQRSHAFVLPCIRAKDGNVDALPTVLLEAMACGCPCISTRLSGIPEILEDGASGLLVEPRDELALADAIKRMCMDSNLTDSIRENGRARMESLFDIERNVDRMRNWYLDLHNPTEAAREGASPSKSAVWSGAVSRAGGRIS